MTVQTYPLGMGLEVEGYPAVGSRYHQMIRSSFTWIHKSRNISFCNTHDTLSPEISFQLSFALITGTIVIHYQIPSGVQIADHPNPG